ncbi:hypothetical protein BCR32DRAFT_283444 [Anaeromyces robustus]|jgi:hypothetical protein|uniref:COPI associated n=1 Tax=Anaeromyces robustus TaxID=1754192 RepID=A0A1Y1WUG2_9FUNG|nr:hypothetical protein BCR32DRAFT_283444 [Anaeromyces robustus]|eukprot:ORX77189.1 hypothetical protein BCR32DRAFT_283444 [Anaeromyces robustus]
MQKKVIYQIINIITALLIGVCGVLNFISNITDGAFSFSRAIICMYYVAFALLFILIAFREIDIIQTEMHFLYSYFGRGLTYLFIGLSLCTTDISIPTVCSIVIIAVGLVYLVQYFKKAEPEF